MQSELVNARSRGGSSGDTARDELTMLESALEREPLLSLGRALEQGVPEEHNLGVVSLEPWCVSCRYPDCNTGHASRAALVTYHSHREALRDKMGK